MVVSLQSKLNEAVSKIVELTKVLTHLNTEYTAEAYYEESAKRAMEPVLAAAQSNYGGTNASNYAKNPWLASYLKCNEADCHMLAFDKVCI